MGRINLEGMDFSYQRRADLVKPKSVSQKTIRENRGKSAEQREIRRLETKNEIYKKAIKILAVPLAIMELVNVGKLASAQGKLEVKKIKPAHSVTLNLKESELRALKGTPVKKEETRPSKVPEEKLSQKTYEVFLNNQNLMKRLNENRQVYEEAAEKTGIDWKIIAAIHYREAELSPNHSTVSGERLGTKNPDSDKDHPKTYYSLLESAIVTGNIFKENLKFAYNREYSLDQETLERGFLAYNRGGSYAVRDISPDESPYVMNFYNENYDNMVWPNSEAEPANLRSQVNQMYGAETVHEILEQAEGEGKI